MKPTAEIVMQPGGAFKAGPWCQFCRGKLMCRTRAKSVFEAAVGDFEELDEETPVETIDHNLLTLEDLGLMLPFVPTIASFCSDLESRAISEIGKGNTVPHPVLGDFKMVEGRSNRKWRNIAEEGEDNEEAIVKELRKRKLKVAEIYSKKLKGPPAIEKIVGRKDPIMKDLVEKPPGKPKLVPGTDKRPALAFHGEEEFEELPEED